MGETVGIHHLHCMNVDEVESGSCLAVVGIHCAGVEVEESGIHLHTAYQKVGQILQKIIIHWIRRVLSCNLISWSVLHMHDCYTLYMY